MDEKKDKNYVESTTEEYHTIEKHRTKYTRKVDVKGNREDYVGSVGKKLILDDPTA